MKENAAEILKTLMRERLARKESERILELKSLEIYEQKLEIDLLRKKLDLEINRKYLRILTKTIFKINKISKYITKKR